MSRLPLLLTGQSDARCRRPILTGGADGTFRTWRNDPHLRRARRVVLLLIVVWVINLVDLLLTLWAQHIGGFHELNPLAKPLVGSTLGLVLFKVSMVSLSSLIMLTYRRHVLTELGCWLLLTAYTGLCFIWIQFCSYDLRPL